MDKIKIAIIILFIGFGIYQFINIGILSSIPTFIAAAILFLVLYCGWDYFGGSTAVLCSIALFVSFVDITSSSNAFNVKNITKQNEIFMRTVETRYCPSSYQPNERKREIFNELSKKLSMSCLQQGPRDILKLHADLSKTAYLDPVVGTVDSFYVEFFSKKDTPITCLDLAQKMDQLCPGLLEL
ncbi:hypothetical protein [Aeromonas enteropelogenes]|uniref:hypothetical protein n=1 Tax=Aeromonas enteropelogenes TaxID=29489 RepID=UPI003BA02581